MCMIIFAQATLFYFIPNMITLANKQQLCIKMCRSVFSGEDVYLLMEYQMFR